MKKLFLISESEFTRLSESDETYFCNGCLFEQEIDNLIAFPVYENSIDMPLEYYKVLNSIEEIE